MVHSKYGIKIKVCLNKTDYISFSNPRMARSKGIIIPPTYKAASSVILHHVVFIKISAGCSIS